MAYPCFNQAALCKNMQRQNQRWDGNQEIVHQAHQIGSDNDYSSTDEAINNDIHIIEDIFINTAQNEDPLQVVEIINVDSDDEIGCVLQFNISKVICALKELKDCDTDGLSFNTIFEHFNDDRLQNCGQNHSGHIKHLSIKNLFVAIKESIRNQMIVKVADRYRFHPNHVITSVENKTLFPEISFCVQDNPKPLSRPKFRRLKKSMTIYNPSAAMQKTFGNYVKAILSNANIQDCAKKYPVYNENFSIEINIMFHMKRPLKHFINGCVDRGLKQTAPHGYMKRKPDVDNLVKFLLDALIGVVYNDDMQVVSLNAMKIWDDKQANTGSTKVRVKVV